jgi:hypothetical protein
MTKAELDAAEAALTTTGLVTKARVNTYTGSLGDEVYAPAPTANTQAGAGLVLTPTIASPGGNFNYSLYFVKQGRVVYVTGVIRNATFGSVSAQNIASGLSGDFAPLVDQFYTAVDGSDNQFQICFDSDGNLKLAATVTTQNDFAVNAHYFTAN